MLRKSEFNCENSLLNSLGTYASEKGSTSDKMAGLLLHLLIFWKNRVISNSDGLGTMFCPETLVLFINWIDEEQC